MQGNYILSFLGAAPMNDPKAVVYLAIDNPKNTIQYGGVVAAQMVGEIFKQILPLMKVEQDFENQIDKEYRYYIDRFYYDVPNLIGKTKKALTTPYKKNIFLSEMVIKSLIKSLNLVRKSQKVELLFYI